MMPWILRDVLQVFWGVVTHCCQGFLVDSIRAKTQRDCCLAPPQNWHEDILVATSFQFSNDWGDMLYTIRWLSSIQDIKHTFAFEVNHRAFLLGSI